MPITKQYLRYSPSGTFNIITSPDCNGAWVTLKNQEGRFAATGTCEDITVWDLNLVEKAIVLPGEGTTVTCITASPFNKYLAAGFKNGSVKTFEISTAENIAIFSGHKSSVNCLAYDNEGHRLASGSLDTHIVIWDVVAEIGIARLSSHTGPITSLSFMSDHNILISSSKDTSIKFWDLDTNHCFKTLLGHRTEVWGIVLMRNEEFLVTGCGDSELRVWTINYQGVHQGNENIEDSKEQIHEKEDENDLMSPIHSRKLGSILRVETGRVSRINCDSTKQILAVHGSSQTLELFMFIPHLEALKKLRKRKAKEKKKLAKLGDVDSLEGIDIPSLKDIVRRLPVIKTKGKIKSSDLILGKAGELRVLVTLYNNSVEMYCLNLNDKNSEPVCRRKILQQGHHSEVRALAFSSDNLAIVTGSGDSVKLWNRPSLTCLRTISTAYVLSLCFVPGDRHALAGTKDGKIIILDLNSGDILEEIGAHEKEVWSISALPDQRGCVSGSSDATLKFWDFDLILDERSNSSVKVLSLLHRRTLKVDDGVLCLKISPNSKFIAVALLDMTVKVFFMDTLKFFLSLYGHKLPVLCMDISSDSTLIVTGSVDRNIKIWGLDFGDCHRSIFAHDDSITGIQFVPKTHFFFSCSKDGKIKQWDADNFQKIIKLDAHFGEAWSLAVSPNGEHIVTSGSDRVLRLFSKTEEPLVLEDEEENEREKEEEAQLVTDAESVVKGKGIVNLPSRKTVGSEKGAEQILECLEMCKQFGMELKEYESLLKSGRTNIQKPVPPPLMLAYKSNTPDEFIIEILKSIRSSDLEESLLLLPFPTVCQLLAMFPSLLKSEHQTELKIRTLMFLFRMHNGPIVSNQTLLPIIKEVNELAFLRINYLRDLVGYNLHGMLFIQKSIEERQGVILFRDATIQRKEKNRKRKKKEQAIRRAVLTI